MMRSTFAIFAVLVGMAGCKTNPVNPPPPPTVGNVTIKWTANGNPGAVMCGAQKTDCLSAIQIKDVTTGAIYSASPYSLSYVIDNVTMSDSFAVQVFGYNDAGQQIEAPLQAVPMSQQASRTN
jgi:hypothetical protein